MRQRHILLCEKECGLGHRVGPCRAGVRLGVRRPPVVPTVPVGRLHSWQRLAVAHDLMMHHALKHSLGTEVISVLWDCTSRYFMLTQRAQRLQGPMMFGRHLDIQQTSLCGGAVMTTPLAATLLNVEIHPHLFDEQAAHGLWSDRPLIGSPRAGAVRLRCPSEELQSLRSQYSGLHMEPLMRSVRSHNGKRPFAPSADRSIAMLILPDYDNLFHQFGSLVIAWAALQESLQVLAADTLLQGSHSALSDQLTLLMLSNVSLAPTALFWSPGLSSMSPMFVRAAVAPRAATYARLIVVQPATESWWWTVWKADRTDRRSTLHSLAFALVRAARRGP